ncbi:CRISPR-associated endonuclease Cas3'' [Bradyrhizobium sp. WD16]|uniref:CRISPR-associated endonuclease Cas3'' n=1 Tax=Bradyrhizobium sp. WD16 TaxID=1521768 RepID=UPI0020A3B7C8|nr:CRISPR-associated endonuclease Cas3'' [Bradyrhizobium sp. WD16]UTD29000.1 CRISPR-associated helicase/endonuclease Cas3 [Bradyrhizobium sp. WD16]
MFFAHSLEGRYRDTWQPLAAHLKAVSQLTSLRAEKFGAGRLGAMIGLLHDLGKYTNEFQDYIGGRGPSPDHATAGARAIRELAAATGSDRFAALIGAYCIAGHHAGLSNWSGDRALSERLRKELPELDPTWLDELSPEAGGLFPQFFKRHPDIGRRGFQLALLGRMLFSCLVDADYRDTETFYLNAVGHSADRDWPVLPAIIDTLTARFDSYMADMAATTSDSPLGHRRTEILAHARAKAARPRGIFTLNVPTGGGKTLTSLGFALDHAKAHGMDRIVYGIPFTSIIDQTAAIFRKVLGEEHVLEHHSAIEEERQDRRSPDLEGERDMGAKMRLAMEDWAAPIIVTTNVQLFESLFANRPSRCRKLHNLVNAVIILDEAQTIPLPVLRPCVAALDELARNHGCSVVLCTATQPALAAPRFKGGFELSQDSELAPDPAGLARELRRVTLDVRSEPLADADLVAEIAAVEQALVIVNSRQHALDLYRAAKAAELTGLVHLSTRQTAADRRRILASIRDDLRAARPCRVVATSLVEAGVDLDFPRVWRAEAGLDQIAQAAGRCNREGRRPVPDSVVKVFRPAAAKPPPEFRPFIEAMQRVIPHHDDLLSPEAIQRYFNEVYWQKGEKRLDQITTRGTGGSTEKMSVLDAFLVGKDVLDFPYRAVAEGFHLIESGMEPVIVAIEDEPRVIIGRLQAGTIMAGAAARKLQRFIVQVPPAWRRKLIDNGHAELIPGYGDQFVELRRERFYTRETGLLWEEADVLALSELII